MKATHILLNIHELNYLITVGNKNLNLVNLQLKIDIKYELIFLMICDYKNVGNLVNNITLLK